VVAGWVSDMFFNLNFVKNDEIANNSATKLEKKKYNANLEF
jgi:hypothetical protein